MAKTLVTGGAGFIGSHVAARLQQRGDDLRLTLRPSSKLDNLEDLDYEAVRCDLLDRRAVRRALRGVDRVFHVAGLGAMRPASRERRFEVNVEATRLLLEECLRTGVDRVVHTSSAAALGPAPPGQTADERQVFTAGSLGLPYVNSMHEGETEALRLAAKGLPAVVVNPCLTFGPGDVYGSSTSLVRRYMLGRLPAYVNGGVNIVDVGDVARGLVAADERGTVGERYILGNRNYTLERLFADISRLSGVEPPAMKLPTGPARQLARLLELAPVAAPITPEEVKWAGQWWTYRSTKARRELGWRPGPHEDTLEATVNWYLERDGDLVARLRRSQPFRYRVAATGVDALVGAAGVASRLRPRRAPSTLDKA